MIKDLCHQKSAFHHYEILETLEAGLVLLGTEVKSLRDGGGTIDQAYVIIDQHGEAWLKGAYIAPYSMGNIHNHTPTRERKLLLHCNEIQRLHKAQTQKGFAVIPLSLYLKKGVVKIKIALGRGKKAHDKRASIAERDSKRHIARAMREHNRS